MNGILPDEVSYEFSNVAEPRLHHPGNEDSDEERIIPESSRTVVKEERAAFRGNRPKAAKDDGDRTISRVRTGGG